MWHEALAGLGAVTPVVAPVAGPAASGTNEIVVVPSGDAAPNLPRLARGLGVERGRQFGRQFADAAADVDLVVAVRSYVGLLAIGLRDATGARLVVDLDDDDVAFFRSVGDDAEAARFERLVDSVRRDADLVVSTQGFGGTRAVPNSVRVPATVPVPGAGSGSRARRVVLMANMGYEPNVTGARWLIDSVLPLVRTRIPDVELVIVGPGSESFAPYGRGYVAELSAVLAGAGVAVAPILHGSGTRMKILDAWAHGLATVSTTIGADGLDAVDGIHLLLADDAESFAAAIVRTLEDPTLAASLGSAGRALVTARYARPSVVAGAQDLLRATLTAPAPGSVADRAHAAGRRS
jgi:glycosyltransferase involved in cell wall biosynthesis